MGRLGEDALLPVWRRGLAERAAAAGLIYAFRVIAAAAVFGVGAGALVVTGVKPLVIGAGVIAAVTFVVGVLLLTVGVLAALLAVTRGGETSAELRRPAAWASLLRAATAVRR